MSQWLHLMTHHLSLITMVIKESSDELNPPVVTVGAVVPASRAARSAKDYLALAIATCGVGYLPLAPGTWGSLVGVGLYLLLRSLTFRLIVLFPSPNSVVRFFPWPIFIAAELALITLISLVGIWAASRTEKLAGRKDPGKVVIDEVAGQMIALTTVPLEIESRWMIVLAFLLFRLFDIVKPYPCRRLESLPSGLGIMADDVVAGVYAAIVVAVVVVLRWFL